MNDLMTAVLLTLAYSHQFHYPLTLEEIKTRLIKSWPHRTVVKINQLQLAVAALVKLRLIGHDRGYYFLSSRKSLIKLRQKRSLASHCKLTQAQRAAAILRFIPWVKAIFITGSLSVMNSEPANDIDFMIVTSARRLWLTRPLVILISLIMGKKRPLNQEKSNSWCFNLWLTERSLRLHSSRRNIFTAHEVLQARCLFDREKIAQKFLLENNWVSQFLPYFFMTQLQLLPQINSTIPGKNFLSDYRHLARPYGAVSKALFDLLGDGLNLLSYCLQRIYMSLHQTQEEVSLEKAFFHPRDTRQLVGQGWERALKSLV